MFQRWWLRGLLLISLTPAPVAAQGIPVMDFITEFQTSLTAIQTTITAVEAVIQTAKWVLDQTPLDEFVMAGDWMADVQELEALVREAQALGYDLNSLRIDATTMFGLRNAPSNADELVLRLGEMRDTVSQGHMYALRTQGIVLTAMRTVSHMVRIYEQASSILGTVSGSQNLATAQTKLVHLATEEKVTGSAHRLAQHLEALQDPLIDESLHRMNEQVMRSHPR